MEKAIYNIRYTGRYTVTSRNYKKSISVIGLDTEAYKSGKCFMFATSNGDYFHIKDFPQKLFGRMYRSKIYVVYNLKYDEGALIQFLPYSKLIQLKNYGKVIYGKWKITLISGKCLTISRNKHAITIYDVHNFLQGSLDHNAKIYLGKQKIDIETKRFTVKYVRNNWDKIGEYCVYDAKLTQELADYIIKAFESIGIYPQKLYSTAYVSFQYYKSITTYPTVKKLWDDHRIVLDYAMRSYNGGKFEVIRKGCDYYYEYDINSAYPYEIANLIDITGCKVKWNKKYEHEATYGFINCYLNIPFNVYSPLAFKYKSVCIYPVGDFQKVLTKQEYDYLKTVNCKIDIIDAVWIFCISNYKPFYDAVYKLCELKNKYKKEGNKAKYYVVKILNNSLYGKMVQLIDKGNFFQAGNSWNPVYASIITANTRIKISKIQQQYKSVIAVHTDSVISTKELPITGKNRLGDFEYVTEGKGVVLGCGIYQIGTKNRVRGFYLNKDDKSPYYKDLLSLIDIDSDILKISQLYAVTWRKVIAYNWDKSQINRFSTDPKHIHIRFDKKRVWMRDYNKFNEVLTRYVYSVPYIFTHNRPGLL